MEMKDLGTSSLGLDCVMLDTFNSDFEAGPGHDGEANHAPAGREEDEMQ